MNQLFRLNLTTSHQISCIILKQFKYRKNWTSKEINIKIFFLIKVK